MIIILKIINNLGVCQVTDLQNVVHDFDNMKMALIFISVNIDTYIKLNKPASEMDITFKFIPLS
jgi:hypothetical protein